MYRAAQALCGPSGDSPGGHPVVAGAAGLSPCVDSRRCIGHRARTVGRTLLTTMAPVPSRECAICSDGSILQMETSRLTPTAHVRPRAHCAPSPSKSQASAGNSAGAAGFARARVAHTDTGRGYAPCRLPFLRRSAATHVSTESAVRWMCLVMSTGRRRRIRQRSARGARVCHVDAPSRKSTATVARTAGTSPQQRRQSQVQGV